MDIHEEVRKKVITLRNHTGKSIREIAEDVGLPKWTVADIIKLNDETGSTSSRRLGRSAPNRKISERDKNIIVRECQKKPQLSSTEIQKAVSEGGIEISASSVRRVLLERNIRSYRPQRIKTRGPKAMKTTI